MSGSYDEEGPSIQHVSFLPFYFSPNEKMSQLIITSIILVSFFNSVIALQLSLLENKTSSSSLLGDAAVVTPIHYYGKRYHCYHYYYYIINMSPTHL